MERSGGRENIFSNQEREKNKGNEIFLGFKPIKYPFHVKLPFYPWLKRV
jgi:hypothetical protein